MMPNLVAMYARAARSATRDLTVTWPVLIGVIGAVLTFFFVAAIASRLGFAGGFIVGMVGVALISLYYHWVSESLNARRFALRDLWSFDASLFFLVLNVGFVIWIATFVIDAFSDAYRMPEVRLLVNVAIIILLNPLPEIIHRQRMEGLPAIREAFDYTKEHWLEWFLPFLVMISPSIFLGWQNILVALANSSTFLPPYFVLSAILQAVPTGGWGALAIAAVIAHWFMLFRAHLFSELSGRRPRSF